MADLDALCERLAAGTSGQKRRAWRALVREGELWRGCADALAAPAGIEVLTASYRRLQQPWARKPLLAPHTDPTLLEQQIDAAARTVAAAAVAVIAQGPGHRELLTPWCLRAAGSAEDGPAAVPETAAVGADLVRQAFGALAAGLPARRREIAAGQDASLSFLRAAPAVPDTPDPGQRLRVPVLLTRGTEGYVGWLWMERLEGGSAQLLEPLSSRFEPLHAEVQTAVDEAWRAATHLVTTADCFDVRWWLTDLPRDAEGAPVPIRGASLQASAAAGFALLLSGQPYDPSCAISATLTGDGALGEVEGIGDNGSLKLRAAMQLKPRHGHAVVIVSPGNRLSDQACAEWEARGVRVVPAANLAQALPFVSGLVARLIGAIGEHTTTLLRDAARQLGRELPDWNSFDGLLELPRVARGPRPRLSRGEYEELEIRRASDGPGGLDSAARHWLDLRAQDVQADLPERRETESWIDVRETLRRALVVGDAGYGKTTLLRHEVARRNAIAIAALRGQTVAADDVRCALFVPARNLAAAVMGQPVEALLDGLSGSFAGEGDDPLRRLLARKLACGDCLLVVDALDEASAHESARRDVELALRALVARWPDLSIVVSCRLAGCAGVPLPVAPEDQLELLAFDDTQLERALARWFGDDLEMGAAVRSHLRAQSALWPLLRCPLLLALACQAARRARTRSGGAIPPLPRWERRTALFETFVADAITRWTQRAAPPPTRDEATALRLLSAELAEHLWRADPRRAVWDARELAAAIEALRDRHPLLDHHRRPALLDDLLVAGILSPVGPDGPDTPLTFSHRPLGEYLAACALAERISAGGTAGEPSSEAWTLLDRKAWDPDCEPVICCLPGVLRDPSTLLERLSDPSPTGTNRCGDDFFNSRLALAALCLAEIPGEHRAETAPTADRITRAVFARWWHLRMENAALAGISPLARAFPVLGQVNARVDGMPLTDRVCAEMLTPDPDTRSAAVDAIVSMSRVAAAPEVLDCLAQLLQEDDVAARKLALEAVIRLGPSAAGSAVPAQVIRLLRDPECWSAAVLAIRCVGTAVAAPPYLRDLLDLLGNGDWHIRQAAARALGALGPAVPASAVLDQLVALLHDEHATVRQAAVEAVVGVRAAEPRVIEILVDLLLDRDPSVRHGAAEAIGRLGAAARTVTVLTRVTDLMEHPDAGVRQTAAWAVRSMGSAAAAPHSLLRLEELLREPGSDAAVSEDVLPSRPSTRSPDALLRVTEFLGHPVPELRQAAAASVAELGSAAARPEVIGRLAPLLRDPDEDVRFAATRAVGAVGASAAVPGIVRALWEHACGTDDRMRSAAAGALARLMARGVRLFTTADGSWEARSVSELAR